MKYSCLPTLPLIVFGILEPLLLTTASIFGIGEPSTFFALQAPNYNLCASTLCGYTSQAETLTLQVLTTLLFHAAIAIICCWTLNSTTTKAYLFVLAVADWGYVNATYVGVGSGYFWNFGDWSALIWGNVGLRMGFNAMRMATLMGAFGEVRGIDERWKRA